MGHTRVQQAVPHEALEGDQQRVAAKGVLAGVW